MPSLLEDLDELALRCRDEKAKKYIAEAVSSYRAGAFRSAIVATWIAVCFDVIEKLRDLALAGDKQAEAQVKDIELTRRTGDLARALKFERELLQISKDTFELISPLEAIDLERLQEDRNRCAHPSLSSDDQAYAPSAELARLHIHSAVTHLLQHPPVQGKYALDRLTSEIDSEYFPTTVEKARVAFASGPLRRPRESLVRNLVLVLTKTLLKDKPDWKRRARLAAALQATRELHRSHAEQPLAARLSAMFRSVEDAELQTAVAFLENVPDCWQYLEADVRQRLKNYVEVLPERDLESLEFLLQFFPLQPQARQRVKFATRKELKELWILDLPVELVDRYIEIYMDSGSFDEANDWAKYMIPYAMDFNADHVRKLLSSAKKNAQILGSFQLGPLIAALRAKMHLPLNEFEALLMANGLEEHSLAAKGQN